MAVDPPDFLSRPFGQQTLDSEHFPNNPLLMPFDGSQVQQILLNFQDTTSYLTNDNSKAFVGTVYGMCSMKEHNQKVQMNTANDLERDRDKGVNPKLTLKSFQRSDAFRTFKPEDVRPSLWCRRTVHYALCYFADADLVPKPYLMDKEFTFLDIYNFLRDRLRSIWQDLTVQRCTKHRGYIESFEISVRFLIYSNEVLCESDEYDVAQNLVLLNTCLDKLMDGYADVRNMVDKVAPSEALNNLMRSDPNFTLIMNVLTFVSAHEAEFWSYRLLLLIPQLLTPGCSATFCDICQRMPEQIRRSAVVRFSISACLAASSGNIYLYFKLMNSRECHPLQAALMNRFSGCIRVRFLFDLLANKIVKDSKNPFKFDGLKEMLGFELEPDRSMVQFLRRYDVNADRGEGYVELDDANLETLGHDNISMAKIAGKTQMRSSLVMDKFSVFKHRQIIFDPDFRAPFISPEDRTAPVLYKSEGLSAPLVTLGSPTSPALGTRQPELAQPSLPVPPKDDVSLVRMETFGSTPISLPTPALAVPEQPQPHMPTFSIPFTPQPPLQAPVRKEYEHLIIKQRTIKPVKLYKPKLKDLPHMYFNEESEDLFKKVEQSATKLIGARVSDPFNADVSHKTRVEEDEHGCKDGFERFERPSLDRHLALKMEPAHVYMSLDASIFYLERELNHYLNKTMSKCILYSLQVCKLCNGSILKSERVLRSLFLSFKRTKVGLLRLVRALAHFTAIPKHRPGHTTECPRGLKQNLSQMYRIFSSKKFSLSALRSYFEGHLEEVFVPPLRETSNSSTLSVFNAVLTSTLENLESVVNSTYTDMLKLPRNFRNLYNPDLWASGLFLHLSFFDLNTSHLSSFGNGDLGNGILQFKDRAQDYMNSEYCVNLKLDILNICGFNLNKQDLVPDSGSYGKRMFQLVACEYPYKNDHMTHQVALPVSLNISLGLRNEYTLSRATFNHRITLENPAHFSDKGGASKQGKHFPSQPHIQALYAQVDRSLVCSSNLYTSAIDRIDNRFANEPQLVVFMCSKTLVLGHKDFIYNLYAKSANVLKFRDKLGLVDSLALLSFLLNSTKSPGESSPSVSCLFCYRLAVSKLDILTIYNIFNSHNVCRCKLKSAKKKIKSVVEAVNKALIDSLVENALGFNVNGAEELLRGTVTFACVGFEYEDVTDSGERVEDGEAFGSLNTVVSRLLYPEGMRNGLKVAWEGALRRKQVKLQQKPLRLPDLHNFLRDLILLDGVTWAEVQRNVQGLLSHSLQRFIGNVILNTPETLWNSFESLELSFSDRRRKRTLEEAYGELYHDYSKNGFVAMLVALKECVKITEFKMRNVRFEEKKEGGGSQDRDEKLRMGLSSFILKVLDLFGLQGFMVPHALAVYMENIASPG